MRAFLKTVGALAIAVGVSAPASAGEDVKLDELPPAVKQTVERETKGAAVKDIERDEEDGKIVYEVEYTKAGSRWELHVGATGKVLSHHRD
jgi:uncharacterized membrane protein YkoI